MSAVSALLRAATALLRLLPVLCTLWQVAGQGTRQPAAAPAADLDFAIGVAAATCINLADHARLLLAFDVQAESAVPAGSPAELAALAEAAMQLHATSCRLVHWAAGMADTQPDWLQGLPLEGGAFRSISRIFAGLTVSLRLLVGLGWASPEAAAPAGDQASEPAQAWAGSR